jgi:F-type H+-transporting ATPase subunit epsilon
MATFHFDLVSPEKLAFSGEVDQVDVPGWEGDFGVLADVATSMDEVDRAQFAETIAEMEAKLAEKEDSELDNAIERLDHYKSIQQELSSTAMH